MTPHSFASNVRIAEEVQTALDTGRPVVALESTAIAHGLPWPVNAETARGAEAAVRQAGAVPATVAVLDGILRIGLDSNELERLATAGPGAILKVSRRDLSAVVAAGQSAATTVSGTLWIARRYGIGVMATGGLGGVHREASATFDISADLGELACSDGTLVVCSGVKAILDVPATMERLETLGVPVIGYGTTRLPGFTVCSCDWELEHAVHSPAEAADLVANHRAMELPGAVVLAQPVPAGDALDARAFKMALDGALIEAEAENLRGKAVTPYLLAEIQRTTGKASLRANKALLLANAGLAGAVAVELAARRIS